MAGILAFSCIQTIQIANLLYTEYTGLYPPSIIHLLEYMTLFKLELL